MFPQTLSENKLSGTFAEDWWGTFIPMMVSGPCLLCLLCSSQKWAAVSSNGLSGTLPAYDFSGCIDCDESIISLAVSNNRLSGLLNNTAKLTTLLLLGSLPWQFGTRKTLQILYVSWLCSMLSPSLQEHRVQPDRWDAPTRFFEIDIYSALVRHHLAGQ